MATPRVRGTSRNPAAATIDEPPAVAKRGRTAQRAGVEPAAQGQVVPVPEDVKPPTAPIKKDRSVSVAKPVKRKDPSPVPVETPQDVRPPKPPKISDRSPSVQRGQPGRAISAPPGPPPLPPPADPPSRGPSQPPPVLDRSRSPAAERAKQLIAFVGQQARRKQDKFKNELSSAVQRVSARQAAQDAAESMIIAKTNPRQKSLDAMISRFDSMTRNRSDSPGGRPSKDEIKLEANMSRLRPKMAAPPSRALALRIAPYVRT